MAGSTRDESDKGAGGKRPRGRPPGVPDSRPRNSTRRRMEEIAAQRGISPLEVMIQTMEKAWYQAIQLEAEDGDVEKIQQLRSLANAVAFKAAPYMHPRLSAVAVREVPPEVPVDTSSLTPSERQMLLTMLRKVMIKEPRIADPFRNALNGPILDEVLPDQNGVEPEDRD